MDGCDGDDGPDGVDGYDGVDGFDGHDGGDGSDGVDGSVEHQIERTGVDDVLGYDYHGKMAVLLDDFCPESEFWLRKIQKFETGGQKRWRTTPRIAEFRRLVGCGGFDGVDGMVGTRGH